MTAVEFPPHAGACPALGEGSPATPDDDFDPASARVVRGNPSDEELAAVVAVIAAVFDAGSTADRPLDRPSHRSAWERSQRTMRGAWSDTSFGLRFGRS